MIKEKFEGSEGWDEKEMCKLEEMLKKGMLTDHTKRPSLTQLARILCPELSQAKFEVPATSFTFAEGVIKDLKTYLDTLKDKVISVKDKAALVD